MNALVQIVGRIVAGIVALPFLGFICWQAYCQLVYVRHFEQRCGEQIAMVIGAKSNFAWVRDTVPSMRVDRWDRQYAIMGYEFSPPATGADNFYCEVNTVRSFFDHTPIRVSKTPLQ